MSVSANAASGERGTRLSIVDSWDEVAARKGAGLERPVLLRFTREEKMQPLEGTHESGNVVIASRVPSCATS